jgi:hypothetical protein
MVYAIPYFINSTIFWFLLLCYENFSINFHNIASYDKVRLEFSLNKKHAFVGILTLWKGLIEVKSICWNGKKSHIGCENHSIHCHEYWL